MLLIILFFWHRVTNFNESKISRMCTYRCALPCSKYSIMLIVPPVTGITVTGGASILCLMQTHLYNRSGVEKRGSLNETFH